VPKKTKSTKSKKQVSPEADGSPAGMKIRKAPKLRRTSTTQKSSASAGKENSVAPKGNLSMPAAAGTTATEPSDDAIRLRAYFISERRRRFALSGDTDSDWLEAKRQLVSEAAPR
jgi:hypothetical protein